MHYARLANKEYSENELHDQEVILSVMAYNEDKDIARKQERVLFPYIRTELEKQYGVNKINFTAMYNKTISVMEFTMQILCLYEVFVLFAMCLLL